MKRREFLAGLTVGAAGLLVPELWVPKRTFFLPPTGGWAPSLGDPWLDYANLMRPAGVKVTMRIDFIARRPAIVELNTIGAIDGAIELIMPEETDAELRDRMLASFRVPLDRHWKDPLPGTLCSLMPWEVEG